MKIPVGKQCNYRIWGGGSIATEPQCAFAQPSAFCGHMQDIGGESSPNKPHLLLVLYNQVPQHLNLSIHPTTHAPSTATISHPHPYPILCMCACVLGIRLWWLYSPHPPDLQIPAPHTQAISYMAPHTPSPHTPPVIFHPPDISSLAHSVCPFEAKSPAPLILYIYICTSHHSTLYNTPHFPTHYLDKHLYILLQMHPFCFL